MITPQKLQEIVNIYPGGVSGLARSLEVERPWVYRRLNGAVRMKKIEELAILYLLVEFYKNNH